MCAFRHNLCVLLRLSRQTPGTGIHANRAPTPIVYWEGDRQRQTGRQRDQTETESESEWFIEKGRGPMSIVVKNTVKQP